MRPTFALPAKLQSDPTPRDTGTETRESTDGQASGSRNMEGDSAESSVLRGRRRVRVRLEHVPRVLSRSLRHPAARGCHGHGSLRHGSSTTRENETMFRPMKPETIERRRIEAIHERARRHAALLRDLREKAERDGPDSIWADMLAMHAGEK